MNGKKADERFLCKLLNCNNSKKYLNSFDTLLLLTICLSEVEKDRNFITLREDILQYSTNVTFFINFVKFGLFLDRGIQQIGLEFFS